MIRLIYYTFVAHSTPIQLALYVEPPIVGGFVVPDGVQSYRNRLLSYQNRASFFISGIIWTGFVFFLKILFA